MRNTKLPPLVEAEWLLNQLDHPNLRVLDATIQTREDWEARHIPGSAFAPLDSLCDPASPLVFNKPPEDWFCEAMGRLGVERTSRIVVLDAHQNMWAARLWWTLLAFGCREVGLLNGGWTSWQSVGGATCSDPCGYPETTFRGTFEPRFFADKQEVLLAIDSSDVGLINALGRRQHRGEVNEYGRPGHIPGSMNVTAWEILDRETQKYKPIDDLCALFRGVLEKRRVLTYCGSGVAAASDAFVLRLLGHENVAVYDGSLVEWCADPELPLSTSG